MKNVEFGSDVQLRTPDTITQLEATASFMDQNPRLVDEVVGRRVQDWQREIQAVPPIAEKMVFSPLKFPVPPDFDSRIPVQDGYIVVSEKAMAIQLAPVFGRLNDYISRYNALEEGSPEKGILRNIIQDTLDYLAKEMAEDEERKEARIQRIMESAQYYINAIVPLLLRGSQGAPISQT